MCVDLVEAFDVACTEIYKLLKTDSFRRFTKTSEFKVAVKHIELTKKNARLISQINYNAQLKSINNNIREIATSPTVNGGKKFNHAPKKAFEQRMTDFNTLATRQSALNDHPPIVLNIGNIAFQANNDTANVIALQSNSATPRVGKDGDIDVNEIDLDISIPATQVELNENSKTNNNDDHVTYIPLKLSNNGPSKSHEVISLGKPRLEEGITRESVRL